MENSKEIIDRYYVLNGIGSLKWTRERVKVQENLKKLIENCSYGPFTYLDEVDEKVSELIQDWIEIVHIEKQNGTFGKDTLSKIIEDGWGNFAVIDVALEQETKEADGETLIEDTPISGGVYTYIQTYLDDSGEMQFYLPSIYPYV